MFDKITVAEICKTVQFIYDDSFGFFLATKYFPMDFNVCYAYKLLIFLLNMNKREPLHIRIWLYVMEFLKKIDKMHFLKNSDSRSI